jgi:hypothetical protein
LRFELRAESSLRFENYTGASITTARFLTLAVVVSYLGARVLRDAAKELAVTGTGALVLSGLVSIAGHALPAGGSSSRRAQKDDWRVTGARFRRRLDWSR